MTTIYRLETNHLADLEELYEQAWWSKGRQPHDIARMLEHSDGMVGLCDADTGKLVAYARFLSDSVYKAIVFDVIVLESRRETGLGAKLMDELLGHPDLSGVAHIELYCLPALVPFYERWGFTGGLGELRYMRKTTIGG